MSRQLIRLTLLNDFEPHGDISCQFSIANATPAKGIILAKEDGILACSYLAQEVLDECSQILSKEIEPKFAFAPSTIKFNFKDGESFKDGDIIAELHGPAHILLGAERTILNFLQRLSGVATYTRKLADLIKDYPVKLLDTRKTMPGMRKLGKEAVQAGGGANHRFNLSDMVLIKENHLIFSSLNKGEPEDICLETFINQTRERLLSSKLPDKEQIKIECEVEKIEQLEPVTKAKVDVIMLDNFSPADVKKAIELVNEIKTQNNIDKKILIEASGGINENTIVDYAKAGVDLISVGAITNKPSNIDLSMLISTIDA